MTVHALPLDEVRRRVDSTEGRRLRALGASDLIVKASDPRLSEIIRHGLPRRGLPPEVNQWRRRNAPNLWRGARRVLLARAFNLPTVYGALWIRVLRANGDEVDLGLASMRVVTTAGMNYLVDAFQNITELENFKYHGVGTGTNAEASSDTGLQTELTTQLNPDSTRATGSQLEGASANIYRTVGTLLVDSSVNVTEHGVFTQAAVPGGTLLDRSVFSAVALNASDGVSTPYEFTAVSGS